jgi:hypothetical protein
MFLRRPFRRRRICNSLRCGVRATARSKTCPLGKAWEWSFTILSPVICLAEFREGNRGKIRHGVPALLPQHEPKIP